MKSGALVFLGLAVLVVAGYFTWSSFSNRNNANETASFAPTPELTLNDNNSAAGENSNAAPTTMKTYKFPGVLPKSEIENKIAIIKTAKGEITFEILADEGPKAASNFIYLAKEGYYNGLNFHRVESWVIQGGDPNCGSISSPPSATGRCGAGGPGYKFEDEPVRLPYQTGIVAMANAGPNTNGSQFFIMKREALLGPNYTIFGRVISGMDVVQKIAPGDTMEKIEIKSR